MSGFLCLGSSCGRGWNTIFDVAPVIRRMYSANSSTVISRGLPRLTGYRSSDMHQPVQAVHQVADVTEAAGLRSVAENRHRLAAQGLVQERGHHAAVVQLHARPIGIEDAGDVGADTVLAMIGHREASANRLLSS